MIGFFAPTSRFGTPEDFKFFVDACHRAGIGVILDWVPGHFPKDQHGLARFDGTALYEHADPRQGEHQDWGTLVFNYGRHEVRSFLLSNALFWLEEFHIDGLRVDAVASMLYLDYSRKAGRVGAEPVRRPREPRGDRVPQAAQHADRAPSIPGRVDHRRRIHVVAGRDAGRCTSAASGSPTSGTWAGCTTCSTTRSRIRSIASGTTTSITFSMIYAFSENFVLPFSHDEVVHGKGSMLDKMPGDVWQKHANAARALRLHVRASRARSCCSWAARSAQWREWNHDWQLDWEVLGDPLHAGHAALGARPQSRLRGANRRCGKSTSSRAGFSWIDCNDHENSVISFMRRGRATRPTATVVRRELHAGAAPRLPHRRAAARRVSRTAQQRRRDLRRQQRRQRRP